MVDNIIPSEEFISWIKSFFSPGASRDLNMSNCPGIIQNFSDIVFDLTSVGVALQAQTFFEYFSFLQITNF